LTGKLLLEYKQKIADLKLIPSGGGAFELKVDGELIYSKLATGQFPDEGDMVAAVGSRLGKKR
jgi:selenoprotein W-related protein